ncbi:MAG: hypothetical protein FI707_10075 [SAR202 cluster bacterium]|jgi:sugar/nucleoside kinase (ribokinase family)|nr:PfkB family carbohydrate kinase [SAR202 cluster bacterium]HAL46969.1 hypothetical protein [Dehalococcoidia bacterium]MDP6665452.1 PfkB family carbohydrate kinase [SAR202 cluster bacterium]MDP6798246.1 PfkB family carbohydrate kinase [SAR202 cluster bacterium]MQG58939.1 hypothetical protein [SAR202 cluster bacterium]|tara:strand:+ start:512 stop:1345 length:834 start_codon:yes stop_codon:yes gene_type:complete
MSSPIKPDVVVVGNVTKDLTKEGYVLGGGVSYAALTVKALGLNPAVVTSCGIDVDPSALLQGIPAHVVPSNSTTTFVNSYHGGRRRQVIKAVANVIFAADVPDDWRAAPLVLLAPIAREIDDSILDAFHSATVAASIQGWVRDWDDQGNVFSKPWDGGRVLERIDAVQFSDDDDVPSEQIAQWNERCPVLLNTRGSKGCRIWTRGAWRDLPAFSANEVDPTGAGDVFSAAYLVRFRESEDELDAARFAGCAASFCVERQGVEGIPNRVQIEARLRRK